MHLLETRHLSHDSCMSSPVAHFFTIEADEKECFLFPVLLVLLFILLPSTFSSICTLRVWEESLVESPPESVDELTFSNTFRAFWISTASFFGSLLEHLWKALWESNRLKFLAGSKQNWLLPSKLNSTYMIKEQS